MQVEEEGDSQDLIHPAQIPLATLHPSTFLHHISFDPRQIPPFHISSSSLSVLFKLLCILFDSLGNTFLSLFLSHLRLAFPLHPKSLHSSSPLLPFYALFLSSVTPSPPPPLSHPSVFPFWLKAHFVPALPLPLSSLSSPVYSCFS